MSRYHRQGGKQPNLQLPKLAAWVGGVLTVAVGLSPATFATAPEDGTAILNGTVTSSDGSPIANASVQVQGNFFDLWGEQPTVQTGADGSYRIAVPPAKYRVAVTGPVEGNFEPGFCGGNSTTTATWLDAKSISPTGCTIVLRRAGLVTGSVHTTAGKPIEGAYAHLLTERGDPVRVVPTDANGRYVFDQVSPGSGYTVLATSPTDATQAAAFLGGGTSVSAARKFTVNEGAKLDATDPIRLVSPGSVTGRVLSANGKPVAGRKIQAFVDSSTSIAETVTNDDGTFLIAGLPLTPVRLWLANRGSKPTPQVASSWSPGIAAKNAAPQVLPRAGEPTKLGDWKTLESGSLEIRVRLQDGRKDPSSSESLITVTDLKGRTVATAQSRYPKSGGATVHSLPVGQYQVLVTPYDSCCAATWSGGAADQASAAVIHVGKNRTQVVEVTALPLNAPPVPAPGPQPGRH